MIFPRNIPLLRPTTSGNCSLSFGFHETTVGKCLCTISSQLLQPECRGRLLLHDGNVIEEFNGLLQRHRWLRAHLNSFPQPVCAAPLPCCAQKRARACW